MHPQLLNLYRSLPSSHIVAAPQYILLLSFHIIYVGEFNVESATFLALPSHTSSTVLEWEGAIRAAPAQCEREQQHLLSAGHGVSAYLSHDIATPCSMDLNMRA